MQELAIFYPAAADSAESITIGDKKCKILYYRPSHGTIRRFFAVRRLRRRAEGLCTIDKAMASLLRIPYIESTGNLLPELMEKLLMQLAEKTSAVFVLGEKYDVPLLCRIVASIQNPAFFAPKSVRNALSDLLLEKTGAVVPLSPPPSLEGRLCILLPDAPADFPAPPKCVDFRYGLPQNVTLLPPPPLRAILRMANAESHLAILHFFGITAEVVEIFLSNYTKHTPNMETSFMKKL